MPKRILRGTVVSDVQNKTVIVRVVRSVPHKRYKKIIKISKNYAAHDEGDCFKVGDYVSIQESSPFSKTKSWCVLHEV